MFQTEKHVIEPAQCMSHCLIHVECVSFNFNHREQICDLNDARKGADSANYKSREGFVYFEKSSSARAILDFDSDLQ